MDCNAQRKLLASMANCANRYIVAGEHMLQNVLLLIFRLSWGWQFFITGQGKLINHNDVTDFFTSLQIPLPALNAWFIGSLECFGGVLLLIGLLSRPVAFLLTIAMTVAYLVVADDRAKVFSIFKDPAPFLAADPFFFLLTAVLVLAFGPGAISIDALIAKFRSQISTSKDGIVSQALQRVIAQS